MGAIRFVNIISILTLLLPVLALGFPEQGVWDFTLNKTQSYWGIYKSLFNESKITLKVKCTAKGTDSVDGEFPNVQIDWVVRETKCYEEYSNLDLIPLANRSDAWKRYFEEPTVELPIENYPLPVMFTKSPFPFQHRCDNSIYSVVGPDIKGNSNSTEDVKKVKKDVSSGGITSDNLRKQDRPIHTIRSDGIYLLVVRMVTPDESASFTAEVHVEMKSNHGYLSANDWPLLPFYGVMCLVYVLFGVTWLIFSFCQWRDLLRVQFWIGGVIFLGMLEMAVFYAEYQNINSVGSSVTGAVLFAEIVSVAKRTLARMLVVIVSCGFGIVRPRLGSTLQRVLFVGGLYFILASMEATLRVLHPVNGPSNRALAAGIPLSMLDAGICWWIFQSLLTTTRTLRLRRNLVKLGLYRQFTNTLIFAVLASVAFMIWSIKYLKTPECLQDWREIWVDEAFWHMEFGVILLVIMILWRPTNNNQRYSFSPLIDNPDDEDEDDLVVNEAFGGNMKIRPKKGQTEKIGRNRHNSIEDELRWLDENLPSDLGEGDLPAVDSEEELISTKFELSKMQ